MVSINPSFLIYIYIERERERERNDLLVSFVASKSYIVNIDYYSNNF